MTGTLLRRTAATLYGAGRSLEWAENLARVVLVHGDTHVDLPIGRDVGWAPLLAVASVERDFFESHPGLRPGAEPGAGGPDEAKIVEYLLAAPGNPSSVLQTVTRVREALRSARPVVPREAWELTNGLWLFLRDHRSGLDRRDARVRWLRQVVAGCERVNGALWGTMRRDPAMVLTRIGQHLGRAELTCRFLAVRAEHAVVDPRSATDPYQHVLAMSILKSLAAHDQFRRAAPSGPSSGSIARFLLQDEAFPRTVASCLDHVRDYLKDLPASEDSLSACADASLCALGSDFVGLEPYELRDRLETLGGLVATVGHQLEQSLLADPGPAVRPAPGPHPARRGAAAPEVVRRYRITHRTTYRYAETAEESENEAHLRPRTTVRQRVLDSSIAISPEPASRSDLVDSLGNQLTAFVIRGAFDEMTVVAKSEVELLAASGPPTGAPWESVCATLDRDRRLDARMARIFRSPSRLVPTHVLLADYAEQSFGPYRPVVEAARELCSRIHRDFAYQPGFTSVTTPLLEVFESRRGVCQDFAHLAVGCLRSVGLAARYVSGYIESFRPTGDQLTGADGSHAWASLYLPGWGWLDLDPTNDLVGCEEHVTAAWGRDYQDVSPLRGSVVGGGPTHDLEVSVEVTRVEPD